MGKRGPQPGWKQAKAAAQAAAGAKASKKPKATRSGATPPRMAKKALAVAAQAQVQPAPVPAATVPVHLSFSERNNPRYLTGADLHQFAHRRGLATSTLNGMSDEKIREQLRYIEARRLENAEA